MIGWLFTNRVGDADDGEEEVGALHGDALQHGHVGQVDEGDVEAEHAKHVADGDQQEEGLTENLDSKTNY